MACIIEFGLLQPSFSTIHYMVCRKQSQETWSQETGSSNPCRKLGRRKQVVVGSSITVNKPQGFSKGRSVVWAVERGTRAETDLSCLIDTRPLGLKIPSLSWRVPVNVPYLSWRVPVIPYLSWWVPVIPYLSWWVPVCRSSSWRSHLVHLLVTRIWPLDT